MRTRTVSPAGHGYETNARCIVDCPGHAGARRREHREERVALGVDLLAAMRSEGGPDEPMVIGEDLRVRIT